MAKDVGEHRLVSEVRTPARRVPSWQEKEQLNHALSPVLESEALFLHSQKNQGLKLSLRHRLQAAKRIEIGDNLEGVSTPD